jgi:poly-gamma-glutamate capsule biosynthesis protein CapA/YwtB (metallophosphatase superfamily)
MKPSTNFPPVPQQIEVIAFQNQTVLYDILFRAASETLRKMPAQDDHARRMVSLPR